MAETPKPSAERPFRPGGLIEQFHPQLMDESGWLGGPNTGRTEYGVSRVMAAPQAAMAGLRSARGVQDWLDNNSGPTGVYAALRRSIWGR